MKTRETIESLRYLLRSDDLKGKSLRGGSVLTAGAVIENVLRFARNMILARLLAPSAFGEMAIVLAGVALTEAFTEVGLRQNVIRNKRGGSPEFLNVVWWISGLRGLALYAISYVGAPFIAGFYGDSDSVNLMRVGFLAITLNGFVSPRVHLLEKEFRFKTWVALNQGAAVISVSIGILAAFLMKNVWALLLAYLAECLFRTALSYVVCPMRPRLKFDHECYKQVTSYSRRIYGLPVIMMLFLQTDVFVIGKVLSAGPLGMYVMARTLAEIPNIFVARVVNPLALPAFAVLQDDRAKLGSVLLRLHSATAMIGLPALAFVGLFAKDILSLAYGTQYSEVAAPFTLLCGYSVVFASTSVVAGASFAVGRPDIHRTASIVRTVLFLIVIYPATSLCGLVGASAVRLLAVCCLIAVQILLMKKAVSVSFSAWLGASLRGIQVSLIVLVPGLIMNHALYVPRTARLLIGAVLCIGSWWIGVWAARFGVDHEKTALRGSLLNSGSKDTTAPPDHGGVNA